MCRYVAVNVFRVILVCCYVVVKVFEVFKCVAMQLLWFLEWF